MAIGVGLAFALVVVLLAALFGASFFFPGLGSFFAGPVMMLIFAVSLIAIHVIAIGHKRTRILAGFWVTFVVLILVLVVTCFALVISALG